MKTLQNKQHQRIIKTIQAIIIAASLSVVMASDNMEQDNPIKNMTLIPAGKFIMGSDKVETFNKSGEFGNAKPWYQDEHPQHTMNVPAFYLDTYEVTNQQYREFIKLVNATPPEHWVQTGYIVSMSPQKLDNAPVKILRKLVSKVFQLDIDTRMMDAKTLLKVVHERLEKLDNLPVAYVRWEDANEYCHWRGKKLPTEAQWEKAARGPDGLEFPWGNEWKKGMSNSSGETWDDGAAPIGSYETDKSAYGIYDMGGNVSEWVADWYDAYPNSDYSSVNFGQKQKVAKGAGWSGMGHYALKLFQRGAYRMNLEPQLTFNDVGFRCAKDH